jgi:hypothetical protein
MPTPRASKAKDRERYPELVMGNSQGVGGHVFESESWSGRVSEASSREDITSPEAWATPKEESGSGFFAGSQSRENMI